MIMYRKKKRLMKNTLKIITMYFWGKLRRAILGHLFIRFHEALNSHYQKKKKKKRFVGIFSDLFRKSTGLWYFFLQPLHGFRKKKILNLIVGIINK